MTLITTEDGKLVLRDGKVGTGQECCCASDACCYCAPQDDFAWMGQPAVTFCSSDTEYAEEQQDQMEFDNALLAVRIQEAEEQGWECLVAVYSEIISIGTCPAPEFGLEGTGEAYRRTTAFLNFSCCGVIDLDTPFDRFPLCIQGPERTCVDNVTAEDCAARCNGVHHPGQACAAEPCVECTFFSAAIDVPVGTFTCPENSGGLQAFTDQLNAKLQALSDAMGGAGYTNTSFVPLEIMSNVDCNNPSAGLCNPPTCESYDIGDGTLLSSGTHYVVGECCGTADFENEIPVFLNGVQFNTIPPCVNGDNPLP